ncbi:hypothetical protein [Eremococcus coleocola]|uniref:hypothetical protein n=1 Tax=Eremococcus coleocola TaxID=88132 RepID=UPI000485C9A5|nr:hypothetical protein [Eremococcus coleocola]
MRQSAWDYCKQVLADYPYYEYYIRQIRLGIKHPYVETDENIGGGKSNRVISQTENFVVRLSDDRRLRRIEEQKCAVEATLREFPEWIEEMIALMYFKGGQVSMTKASDLVGKNFRTAQKSYLQFMESLADKLGLIKEEL